MAEQTGQMKQRDCDQWQCELENRDQQDRVRQVAPCPQRTARTDAERGEEQQQRNEFGQPMLQRERRRWQHHAGDEAGDEEETAMARSDAEQRQHQASPLTIRISAATALASSIAGL